MKYNELATACQGREIREGTRRKVEAATNIPYQTLRLPVADLITTFYEAADAAGVFK